MARTRTAEKPTLMHDKTRMRHRCDFCRSWGWASILRSVLAACAGFALLLPVAAKAAEGPVLTVVMDGSGSMWGKLGSERLAKFQVVRQGLAEALPKLPAATRVGMLAFGHRRAGCQDVEVLRAPETGEHGGVADLLNEFNPKGRGPITAALQGALETMPKDEHGTILLVHDDLDNCQQNPCALMEGIKAQYPRLVIHVLSIGLGHAEARQMQCLTVPTNGQHYLVTSGAQVVNAIAEVVELAARMPRPASPMARGPASAPQMPMPDGPGVQLVATLGATLPAPDMPVRWRVERLGSGEAPAVQQFEGGAVTLPLPRGRYAATAELDRLSTRHEFEVTDVPSTRMQVALQGGTLNIAALAGRTNKPLDGTRFIVRPLAATSEGKPAQAGAASSSWIARGPRSEVALPAGSYEIVVTLGGIRAVQEATVAAGERRAVDVRLPVGELELAAIPHEGSNRLEQATYVIQEDDPDSPQGRREVARSAAARPVFTLPAGTYHVIATHGAVEVRDRVAIGAGEVVRRDLLLNSAEINLASGLVSRLGNTPDEVQWRVVPIDRRDAKPLRLYGENAHVMLAAGKYRIEGRFGPLNAEASRDISIAPGARENVSLTPAAARVRLRLATEPGEAVSDIFWKVRLQNGPIVWSSTENEPVGLLQQGKYVIEVQTRQARHEQLAEIRAGADRVLIVGEN
jgi:Ca-activated chloride channel family protein